MWRACVRRFQGKTVRDIQSFSAVAVCTVNVDDRFLSMHLQLQFNAFKRRQYSITFNLLKSPLSEIRSHPEMVGDMSRVTLNFDLSKIPLCIFSQGQGLYSHQKFNIHVYYLLVFIWERLQTPTTTTTTSPTPTTSDATVQPPGRHISNHDCMARNV